MSQGNNDIDNVNVVLTTNYNDIDNDNNRKFDKSRHVEVIADKLMDSFKAHLKPEVDSRPFFCKIAWRLSEARIWDNVEQANKGRNPMGLFIYLCKRDGV